MKKDNLLLIASTNRQGQTQEVQQITQFLESSNTEYKVIEVATPPEISKVLKKQRLSDYTAIAVYGGDGSVIETIKALLITKTPLLILPGGTANTIANYLHIPNDPLIVIKNHLQHLYIKESLSVASINNKPLVMDTHFGVWSEAIANTPRNLKNKIGKYAYGWQALRQHSKKPSVYEYSFNKHTYKHQAYTMLVVNIGEQNILGVPLFKWSHRPDIVQIAVIKSKNPLLFFIWYIAKKMFRHNINSIVTVQRTPKITINRANTTQIWDDQRIKATLPISIQANQYSVNVLAPPLPITTSVIKKQWQKTKLLILRASQRIKVAVFGSSSEQYSFLAPGLFVGGMYRSRTYKMIKEWGITGIVNMREATPPMTDKIEVLHLPTKDLHQPKISQLEQGVEFIKRHINNGGNAYVHCKLGEGRGPTMAAAYLISTGLTAEEAINHIKKYRPFIKPTQKQLKQLIKWQNWLQKSAVSNPNPAKR